MVLVVFQIQRILKCYVVNVMQKELSAQIVDAKKVELNFWTQTKFDLCFLSLILVSQHFVWHSFHSATLYLCLFPLACSTKLTHMCFLSTQPPPPLPPPIQTQTQKLHREPKPELSEPL